MSRRSLAFATDLALRAAERSEVRVVDGAGVVVRTPANPAFRWGNFLLVPEAGDPALRARQHAEAFPGAGFVAVGVDDADAVLDEAAWTGAGFEVERLTVLVMERPVEPRPHPLVRPLVSEADWAAQTAIALSLDPDGDEAHLEFTRRATAAKRAAVESGAMLWLGVEDDGEVVATAGIGDAGDGLARFQDVQTRESHRRRGHASALIAAGTAAAAAAFASGTCVLVAEPAGPAVGLYRRLGFRDVETQVQLTRVDRAVGAPA